MPTRQTRPKSRYERSSFQGLSIIEGECSNEPLSNKLENDFQFSNERNERRRRISSIAQTHHIWDIIATTVENLKRHDGDSKQYAKARDRPKEVLKEAKESGYSAERIFSLLGKISGQGTPDEELVPTQSFVEGLRKLGWVCQGEELDYITNRFDLNRDGMVSLAEFQHYCYHEIPSVAWKAERQRLEKAAGITSSGNVDCSAIDECRFDTKEIRFGTGPEVQNTSKLFWKQDVSVNISLRYCSDLDIITMVTQNVETKTDYKPLYINKSDCIVDREALEEAATLAVQTSDEKTDEGKDLIRTNIHWELYSNYLVARLQMTKDGDSYLPILAKLHADEFIALDTEKPSNLVAPQRRNERPSGGMDEFKSKVKSFQRDSRSARTSRQSAQELSYIVESALNEILVEGMM